MPEFGFAFTELQGSPREKVSLESGLAATREFRVPWSQRFAFVQGMLFGSGAGNIYPAAYPGLPALLCVDAEIKPESKGAPVDQDIDDPETAVNAYAWARITLNYTSVRAAARQEQVDGTYVTYDSSGTAEFLTVASRKLRWFDTGKEVSPDAHGAILIPTTRHTLTWHGVASPPWAVMQGLRGRVNSEAFAIPVLGINAYPETLLFEAYDTSVKSDAAGAARWDISYNLVERTIIQFLPDDSTQVYGWNHSFRDDPDDGIGWVRTVARGDDNVNRHPYRRGDLTALFVQA